MKTLTAKKIIKLEYGNSKNPFTPNIIKYGKIDKDIAFELSSGVGIITGNKLYGIAIAEIKEDGKTERRTDISKSFGTKFKAEMYIKQLKEDFKAS